MISVRTKTKVKKLHEDAILPQYASNSESGADVFAIQDYVVKAGERVLVKTGIAIELPQGYEAQVRSKSGIALKSGVMVLNSPGTIDESYRGEVGVILFNTSKEDYIIEKGHKVAQLVIVPVEQTMFIEAEELSDSVRGEGGFGSTGLGVNPLIMPSK